jgi:hypothetical protein
MYVLGHGRRYVKWPKSIPGGGWGVGGATRRKRPFEWLHADDAPAAVCTLRPAQYAQRVGCLYSSVSRAGARAYVWRPAFFSNLFFILPYPCHTPLKRPLRTTLFYSPLLCGFGNLFNTQRPQAYGGRVAYDCDRSIPEGTAQRAPVFLNYTGRIGSKQEHALRCQV